MRLGTKLFTVTVSGTPTIATVNVTLAFERFKPSRAVAATPVAFLAVPSSV